MSKEKIMIENKNIALTGSHNKRLNNTDLKNNQCTAPLADVQSVIENSKLTIPPEEDVLHAKDWVDDGSLL